MVLAESGLNNENISLIRPIYIEKFFLVLQQVVLIAREVLILSGLYRRTLLYLRFLYVHVFIYYDCIRTLRKVFHNVKY